MKTIGRISPRAAGLAGVLALLASAPQAASAQAVGGYMRSGVRQAAPSPVQPAPVRPAPQYTPMQPGRTFERPIGPSGPSYNRPIYNPPVYNNGPAYNNGSGYNNGPAYNNSSVFRNGYGGSGYTNNGYSNGYNDTRPTGPVVVIPDASDNGSDYRFHRPRPTPPPVGPGNGFFNNSTPPVGPANGFGSVDRRPVGPSAPGGGYSNGSWRRHRDDHDYNNNYVYNTYTVNPYPIIAGAPPLLGGYYYGNYCNNYAPSYTYPSVYSAYDGFPQYIFNSTPNVIVVGQPYYPAYTTGFQPFYTPSYSVTYNQNNYYVASESRAQDLEAGGDRARVALRNAYPAGSYQAAFGDIARAWMDGDLAPLKRHLRDTDTRISVFLNKKYSYSIASGDFTQITRDALDRLHTVSFDFTRLRKAKNGDVTAYGTHVYRVEAAAKSDAQSGGTVPFDQGDPDRETNVPYDKSGDPAEGREKTVYVSYTLRHKDTQWYIVGIDSADKDLVPDR